MTLISFNIIETSLRHAGTIREALLWIVLSALPATPRLSELISSQEVTLYPYWVLSWNSVQTSKCQR